MALMVWPARFKEAVVKVALPPLKETLPMVVAPSMKVTAPVGVPWPGKRGRTVTLKVTT